MHRLSSVAPQHIAVLCLPMAFLKLLSLLISPNHNSLWLMMNFPIIPVSFRTASHLFFTFTPPLFLIFPFSLNFNLRIAIPSSVLTILYQKRTNPIFSKYNYSMSSCFQVKQATPTEVEFCGYKYVYTSGLCFVSGRYYTSSYPLLTYLCCLKHCSQKYWPYSWLHEWILFAQNRKTVTGIVTQETRQN